MRTLIRVENANCTDCLNTIQDVLTARSLVKSVQLHAADGCIEVEHNHDEPEALVELLRTSLRGWQMADNGEIIQIPSIPEVKHLCHLHDTQPQPAARRSSYSTDVGGESPCFAHLLDSDPRPSATR
jgi:hypothetical protein